jgi:N-acetylglucosaminyl-diphospho-decaprenol L-rhamnosyltransferase
MDTPLSVVMVNYYSERDLEECMTSFQKFEPALQYEWIVIDNGSIRGDLRRSLRTFAPALGMELIQNRENMGFARAVNQGVALSHGKYILLLNPDMLLVENSISQMMDFLNQHPEIGVVGCKHIWTSGKHNVGDAGYYPTVGRAFNHAFFLSRFFRNTFRGIYVMSEPKGSLPLEVDWVSGGCLLLRKEIFHQAGGMDETLFLYSEDIEWCSRVRGRGWEISYLPYTHTIHNRWKNPLGGADPGLWLKNLRNIYRRDHPEALACIFSFILISGLILRLLIYFFLHLLSKDPEDMVRAKTLLRSVFAYFR